MTVVFDRPVREITVRAGTQTNCAGFARITASLEPAERFEFVDAHDPVQAAVDDEQLAAEGAAAVRRGVIAALIDLSDGVLPAVRFVLRHIYVNPVDSVDFRNEEAGRKAVAEAVRQLSEAR